ncbi:MAG: hypothetical protein MK212_20730 [Saprospiraceae bacterium]|nr:hypothetical protein [Saprospiraceae bacterium]
MEDILDTIEEKKPQTNYRKWAFRFFVYSIIANLVLYYKVATFVRSLHSEEDLVKYLMILSIVIYLCLILGLVFIGLMYTNKEEKNYQYKISLYGIPILIILMIFVNFV